MKTTLITLLLIATLSGFSQPNVTPKDLQSIIGSWEGTLTYLDYQTNNPFTMAANLEVSQGKDEYSLVLENIYPDEPKANGSYKIKISKEGSLLNKNEVTSRSTLDNGLLQVQTVHTGKDDNKKAQIRYSYIVGPKSFVIRKEVQFNEGEEWIKRSEFTYRRKE